MSKEQTSTNKDGDQPACLERNGSADWRLIADKLAEALVRAKMYIPLKQRYQAQDHLTARLALEDYQAAIKLNNRDVPTGTQENENSK